MKSCSINRAILLSLLLVSGGSMLFFSAAAMINSYYRELLNPAAIAELSALRAEALKPGAVETELENFRIADFIARRSFFSSLIMSRKIPWLIFASFAVLALSLILLECSMEKAPVPIDDADIENNFVEKKAGVYVLLSIISFLLVFALLISRDEKRRENLVSTQSAKNEKSLAKDGIGTSEEIRASAPSSDVADNWPFFRGPYCNGRAPVMPFPTEWNHADGKNIKWKSKAAKSGNSSPVIWGGKIFITGADKNSREAYCFDIENGNLLWTRKIAIQGDFSEKLQIFDETGYAAPSMALDSKHAVAIFANGDIACLDHDGRMIWQKNLGFPDNPYGYASSPTIFNDMTLIQYDMDNSAFAIALKIETGEEIWRIKRDVISCWSSPAVLRDSNGEPIVIMVGNPYVVAYALKNGRELWRHECMFYDLAVSPAFNDRLAFFPSMNDRFACANLQTGELVWSINENLPDVSSPLLSEMRAYTASSSGALACISLQDGSTTWLKHFEDGFYSSPIISGNKIYLCGKDGKTHVFEDSNEFKLISSNDIGEAIFAVPAFYREEIVIRTLESLYCIKNMDIE